MDSEKHDFWGSEAESNGCVDVAFLYVLDAVVAFGGCRDLGPGAFHVAAQRTWLLVARCNGIDDSHIFKLQMVSIAFATRVLTFGWSLSMRSGYNGMLGCVDEDDRS